jgi:hypothetical protein
MFASLTVQDRKDLVAIEIGSAKNHDVLLPLAALGYLEKPRQGKSRRALDDLVLPES